MGNESGRRPARKESPFREWVSDNLRYIILIAIIAVAVILVLFLFGIIGGNNSAQETASVPEETVIQEQDSKASSAEATPTPTPAVTKAPENNTAASVTKQPEETGGITEASDSIKNMIAQYFAALAGGDPDGAAAVTESISESDVTAIINGVYMRDYADIEVLTYPGEREDEYVALVSYTYTYPGYQTRIPALTALYIIPGNDGSPLIASEDTEDRKSEVISKALSDKDALALRDRISAQYDEALASDPELAAYISSIG